MAYKPGPYKPWLIRHGRADFEDWVEACGLAHANSVALFDHHDVADTLDRDEAIELGISLEHLPEPSVLCSYGKDHSHEVYDNVTYGGCPFRPFLRELEG